MSSSDSDDPDSAAILADLQWNNNTNDDSTSKPTATRNRKTHTQTTESQSPTQQQLRFAPTTPASFAPKQHHLHSHAANKYNLALLPPGLAAELRGNFHLDTGTGHLRHGEVQHTVQSLRRRLRWATGFCVCMCVGFVAVLAAVVDCRFPWWPSIVRDMLDSTRFIVPILLMPVAFVAVSMVAERLLG
eukprot:c9302_g1_i5.p1 GENE.c9302_g1_i5~~c9302_g1_i5.p1  ORF type:complete len:188 (+),score=56.34 c9302_g1_i5:60-623(+)